MPWVVLNGLGVLILAVACSSSSPAPTVSPTPAPTATPTLTVYAASVIEDGCDAADKMLYILEGGIGRDEQFSEKVLERGMTRVIQDYDSNEDALAVHVDAMVEAALVAEQNHGYPSKLTEPSLMVGSRQGGIAYARVPAARIRGAVSALAVCLQQRQ